MHLKLKAFLGFNLLTALCLSGYAQDTAFTYQGVLSQNGAAVNGSNDLTFTLYNAVSSGATVGTSNVVNDLVMTNGRFTVTLDFGAGAFDGTTRWLQIAARPGASAGAYTNLVPRTPITPTPYAIYAASAATAGSVSSVAASNITGTIDDGHLSANVARLDVGNTFSESQTIRTSAGGLVISSSTGGQFGSGTLRVQGNTGLGADPNPLYRLFVAGNMSASSYVGDGSQLANVEAETYLGPVADNQLSANIARRTTGNTFNGNQIIASGNVGIGTATPNNLLDVAAGGIIGSSTVLGIDYHDVLNRGTKVSFGYNVLGSEFNGMRAVVNPGTASCGNSGDLLFYTWECDTSGSREVMRINGRGNVIASGTVSAGGNLSAGVDLSVGGYARISGNVGIGEDSPGFPLNFGNILGDKVALFGNVAGQPSFGLGIQSSLLQIHTSDAGSDVAFGYGSSAAMTETMRIKGNGKVGIGTSNPMTSIGYPGSGWDGLHARALGGSGLHIIQGTLGSRLHLRTDNNMTNVAQDFIIANSANQVDFQWLGSALGGRQLAMTITTNGYVGINTASPTSRLEVAGNARINGRLNLNSAGATTTTMLVEMRPGDEEAAVFLNSSGGALVSIQEPTTNLSSTLTIFTGTAQKPGGGSWAALSDARAKKNVHNLEGALARLLALRSVTYEYKDPTAPGAKAGTQNGFIAQEVEPLFPDWVTTDAKGMKMLSISGFESLTVAALRELQAEKDAQFKRLEAQNAKLQEQNQSLEQRVAALEKLMKNLTVAQGGTR